MIVHPAAGLEEDPRKVAGRVEVGLAHQRLRDRLPHRDGPARAGRGRRAAPGRPWRLRRSAMVRKAVVDCMTAGKLDSKGLSRGAACPNCRMSWYTSSDSPRSSWVSRWCRCTSAARSCCARSTRRSPQIQGRTVTGIRRLGKRIVLGARGRPLRRHPPHDRGPTAMARLPASHSRARWCSPSSLSRWHALPHRGGIEATGLDPCSAGRGGTRRRSSGAASR